jgi:hypothetical protein
LVSNELAVDLPVELQALVARAQVSRPVEKTSQVFILPWHGYHLLLEETA